MAGGHLVALDSARSAGDRQGEAWVLNNLGMVSIQQHQDEAIGYFEQAQAIRREIGDLRGEAQAANNLADAYLRLGQARGRAGAAQAGAGAAASRSATGTAKASR